MHWNSKFSSKDITYHEILEYPHYDVMLRELGHQFCASSLLTQAEDLESYTNAFFGDHTELNALLLHYIPGHVDMKWCTLPALLKDFGVHLPHEAQELFISKVNFPSQNPENQLVDPSTIGMQLDDSMTLRELSNLVRAINSCLEPIAKFLNMLVFFKLTKSSLFDIYRSHYLERFAVVEDASLLTELTSSGSFFSVRAPPSGILSSSITFAPPAASLAFSAKQVAKQDSVEGPSMKSIVDSLQSIYDLIHKIMKGTATYLDIAAGDEQMLKRLDMKREFAILSQYAQMEKLPRSDYEGLEGVQSMLEIFQCSTLVMNISLVCDRYNLEACKNDSDLKEVVELTQDYTEERHRFEITPLDAIAKMKRVKEILCMSGRTSLKCLDIFEAVLESAAFCQFVKDKHFDDTQGQTTFQQLHQLIYNQLQHEKYDEQVLNHLLPAFKVITPFMDVNKRFNQLMKAVTSLNAENSLEQLKTVNANIMLIRHWFHRAKVSLCTIDFMLKLYLYK